jgi:hypothetical protein
MCMTTKTTLPVSVPSWATRSRKSNCPSPASVCADGNWKLSQPVICQHELSMKIQRTSP